MPKQNKKEESVKDFDELLKEREKDSNIDEELKEIYDDESPLIAVSPNSKDKEKVGDNNINNMRTIKRRETDPWVKISWTFLALLFVLAGSSWAIFYIFQESGRLNAKDVEFNIAGPEEVIAGQEVIYEIQYKNLSEFNLKNAQIYFTYPNNFSFIDAAPLPDKGNNVWEFEQIDTKRSGRIAIKGKIIGAAQTEGEFRAAISYRPENFSSTFSAEDAATARVISTGVNPAVEAPSFFNVNEETAIILTYARQKESFINSFRARLEHGENFIISGENKEAVWEIKEITDARQTLELKGTYTLRPQDGEKIKLVLEAPQSLWRSKEEKLAAAEDEIQYYSFYEYEFTPIVIEGALNLTLTVNGSGADKPVNFGDTLNYVAHYKNASEAELKNIIIMAAINSPAVDWRTFSETNKGEIRDNTIMWTKTEIKELLEIAPGEENSFSFSIKIKTREELQNIPTSDLEVITSLDYSVDSAVTNDGTPVVKVVNPINSDLNFVSELRYFDRNNIAVGEGPLPPKVGEKTTYRAYFTLTNSRHDLENLEITAALPENIVWANNHNENMGAVSYNSAERTVIWKINSWDAVDEPAMFNFVISVTPSASDRNKVMTILNQTRVEAKDKETSGIIVLTGKAKTSNLEDDEVGRGYGKVE